MITPVIKNKYSIWHYGITGRIGDGDNTEIHFLQSSLKMSQLEAIKLLVDIPGSEKWGIRDLFQRNVDRSRINGKEGLKEYFKDKKQVKYFNPITLVLLPVYNDSIEHDLPKLKFDDNVTFDNINGSVYTNSDHYRLYIQNSEDGNIGKIEWNEEKCYVVAIDGQHRLTALKELYAARNLHKDLKEIKDWQIPVVFLVANKKVASGESKDLIAIIRKIFMYINMKAERVSDTRSILLNDESVECICVEEIVSSFHVIYFNENPNKEYPPLYLIDWLGENSDASMLKDTRYLFSNIELRNWMREFLIGEDFKESDRKSDTLQMKRLEMLDMNFDFLNNDSVLTQSDTELIRNKFNSMIRDFFISFIVKLKPINKYITLCREYESNNSNEDAQVQAFSQLRYGYIHKEESNRQEIDTNIGAYQNIFLEYKKESMTDFMRQDIFLRGFVFAYSEIYDIHKSSILRTLDWGEFTNLYLPAFNNLIEEGWCEKRDDLEPKKKELLTHICHDDTGRRVNYKINDIRNAWGLFVVMHVLNYAVANKIISNDFKIDSWGNYKDRLESSLQKGFREVVKREADQLEKTKLEKDRYINDKKKELAKIRLADFENLWGLN